jgi:hypothetical protein
LKTPFPPGSMIFLRFFLILIILCGTAAGVSAGPLRDAVEAAESMENGKIRFEPWAFVNIGFGYSGLSLFPGVDTVLWYTFGGDVDSAGFYQKPDGSVYSGADPGVDPETDLFYYFIRAQFSLGVSQGIIPGVEWYFFTRFQSDSYLFKNGARADHLLTKSDLPEKEGIALIYCISGFNISTEVRHRESRVKEGITVDICGSAAPGTGLNTVNGTRYSYGGVHADIRGFLPYLEIVSPGGLNLFSIYQGWWLRGDYVFGEYIPLQVLQNVSGRMWKEGLGGAVRGADTNRYPAPLKVIASTDLRFNLPAVGLPSFLPGAVLFFDAGYYRFFTEIAGGDNAGMLLSAGGGIFIDLFGIGEIVAQSVYLINDTNTNGSRFTPLDIGLNLHF